MTANIEKDIGVNINLGFGVALTFPINDKFKIQSDIGFSFTPWGFETIEGQLSYLNKDFDTSIFIDPYSMFGFMGSLTGNIILTNKISLVIGANFDLKIDRTETIQIIAPEALINIKSTDKPDFIGFNVMPMFGVQFSI